MLFRGQVAFREQLTRLIIDGNDELKNIDSKLQELAKGRIAIYEKIAHLRSVRKEGETWRS